MKHAFVHDRIFHIGGAEAVFFDLIREKSEQFQNKEDISSGICIYTLFSDRSHIDIDGHTYPITRALPAWINVLFVYFSTPHHLHLPEDDLIFSEEELEKSTSTSKKVKTGLNIANKILMTCINVIRQIIFGFLMKLFDYRNLIVIAPRLTKRLYKKIMKNSPETITISSFAAVKNIIPVGKKNEIPVTLYLHSPMQYIRENYDEYCQKLATWQRLIFKPVARRLRKRDIKSRHYDYVLCNSRYTLSVAKDLYNTKKALTNSFANVHIQYPRLSKTLLDTPPATNIKEYYVYVGRLVKFIRETDLIIRLANEIHIPLLIVGSGPDEHLLKDLAGDTVQFVGQVTDMQEKIQIISQSRGLINLTKESCGIATMEALALGVPVMGYNAGATPEFVHTSNGVLAENKDMEHLIEIFRTFHTKAFDRQNIKQQFITSLSRS